MTDVGQVIHEFAAGRIALASCRDLPEGDSDARHLISALAGSGIEARPVVWDDPRVDWSDFDLTIVRSCWDYVDRREDFIRWARSVPGLLNSVEVIGWNTDKRYLLSLSARHIPIVPTTWIHPSGRWIPIAFGRQQQHWVIKPAVGQGSVDAARYDLSDPYELSLASDHVRRLQAQGRTVMIQPYVERIDVEGETSLIYFGGVFSHAVWKRGSLAASGDAMDRSRESQDVERVGPTRAQRQLADDVLERVPAHPHELLYARVDIVPDERGRPVLMELELTEPRLHFDVVPGAAELLAEQVQRMMTAQLQR